ncbi:unnamed protein product [Somion occarium]|uniref:Uncharacterized protein n=1 Tax=Somion occarium TaxID=3059160 RepID=A0ABP1CYL1_9APHY
MMLSIHSDSFPLVVRREHQSAVFIPCSSCTAFRVFMILRPLHHTSRSYFLPIFHVFTFKTGPFRHVRVLRRHDSRFHFAYTPSNNPITMIISIPELLCYADVRCHQVSACKMHTGLLSPSSPVHYILDSRCSTVALN